MGGAAGWVTDGATLAPIDFRADVDFKRSIAPVPMAVIEGLMKSTNHHLDLDLQEKFLGRVGLDGHVERDGRLFRCGWDGGKHGLGRQRRRSHLLQD